MAATNGVQKNPDLAHNGRGGRCHCGRFGTFGYKDRAPWPRRLTDGSTNATSGARLVCFCAAHRWAQFYADVGGGGER
jgi:hypothetical protein